MTAMTQPAAEKTPDFLVQWRDPSSRHSEALYWGFDNQRKHSKLRDGAYSFHTDTTHIEVSNIDWPEATSLTFTPNLIGITLLVACTASIRYEYTQGGDSAIKAGETGTMLFMLPGREIRASMSAGRMQTVTCSFEGRYAETIIGPLQQLTSDKLHRALDMRSGLISAVLLRLMQEAVNPGAISEDIVRTYGQALLLECYHWLSIDKTQSQASRQLLPADFEQIEQCLSNTNGRFPTVNELAKNCGLSERYFAKLFRQQTGMTISEHLKAVRIARAKSLLLDTQLPLKEVAYRLGYSSAANFSSAFRAATGTAPGQYRRQS